MTKAVDDLPDAQLGDARKDTYDEALVVVGLFRLLRFGRLRGIFVGGRRHDSCRRRGCRHWIFVRAAGFDGEASCSIHLSDRMEKGRR